MVKQAKTEREVWEMMNKGRKKGGINESIREEEWNEYFMRLLEGVEERVMRRDGGGKKGVKRRVG